MFLAEFPKLEKVERRPTSSRPCLISTLADQAMETPFGQTIFS